MVDLLCLYPNHILSTCFAAQELLSHFLTATHQDCLSPKRGRLGCRMALMIQEMRSVKEGPRGTFCNHITPRLFLDQPLELVSSSTRFR